MQWTDAQQLKERYRQIATTIARSCVPKATCGISDCYYHPCLKMQTGKSVHNVSELKYINNTYQIVSMIILKT